MQLLMPFVDQSDSFAYGFECGQVWAKMEAKKLSISGMFHQCNYQQFCMMAEHFNYKISKCSFQSGETWVELKFQLKLIPTAKQITRKAIARIFDSITRRKRADD